MKVHVLIVEACFYRDISVMLAAGAEAALKEKGASFDRVEVPGALEIPAVIRFALESGKYDGFVALGCVIRGETSHYDVVAGESARGLMELMLHHGAVVGNGILTVENHAQALRRADPAQKNKGAAAVDACLSLIAHKRRFAEGAR